MSPFVPPSDPADVADSLMARDLPAPSLPSDQQGGAARFVDLDEVRRHLQAIAPWASRTFASADGVGATLMVRGQPVFAGSNPFTDAVDEVQYGVQRGPCITAVASGRVVRSRSIGAGERRWGGFTACAATLGLRSATSIPVMSSWGQSTGSTVIGSLNLYGRSSTSLDLIETSSLLRGAELLERALASAWLVGVAAANAQTLVDAVRDREAIDLAVGLLMDRYVLSAAHARILISQVAAQDQVSEPDAARALADQSQRAPHEPTPDERG